jgi:outer membrane protein TolC
MNKFKLLIISLLGIAPALQAQQLEMTLTRSIALATDSSLQAFSAKNTYQASYWAFRTYQAARLPSLTLSMTPLQYYRDITRRYDSENNIDVYRRQQSLYSFGNLSIRQNFDLTGGTFYLDSELGYMRNFGDNVYSQYTTVPVRIGYSQNLFGFNSFRWEKRIEPLKYDKARKQYLFDRETIAETSTEHFFTLAMAQAEYDMARDNVASTDTLHRIGEERLRIASISQSDLLTLKLEAVNARNSLKNAEISLKRAISSFVSYLNLNKETDIRIILPEKPKDLVINEEDALSHAHANHPDFLANRQETLEAEREVDRALKGAFFDASISASVGFNQVANTLGAAYTRPLQQDVISFGFTLPLVDWGVRKGRLNLARNTLNVKKISIQQREQNLEQDIVMTVSDFNVQQDLIRSAEEALDLANLAYNTTRERFIIGRADINSLTLSLNRQKEAQKNHISALKNFWLSYYKIRKLTLFDFSKNETLSVFEDYE